MGEAEGLIRTTIDTDIDPPVIEFLIYVRNSHWVPTTRNSWSQEYFLRVGGEVSAHTTTGALEIFVHSEGGSKVEQEKERWRQRLLHHVFSNYMEVMF